MCKQSTFVSLRFGTQQPKPLYIETNNAFDETLGGGTEWKRDDDDDGRENHHRGVVGVHRRVRFVHDIQVTQHKRFVFVEHSRLTIKTFCVSISPFSRARVFVVRERREREREEEEERSVRSRRSRWWFLLSKKNAAANPSFFGLNRGGRRLTRRFGRKSPI